MTTGGRARRGGSTSATSVASSSPSSSASCAAAAAPSAASARASSSRASSRSSARGDALAIIDCNGYDLRVSRRLRSYELLPAAEFPFG